MCGCSGQVRLRPRRPAAPTDGETSGRREGALALLPRKRYHGNPQPLTAAKLVLLECVSPRCFPAWRADRLEALKWALTFRHLRHVSGGAASANGWVITPEQLLQVDECERSTSSVPHYQVGTSASSLPVAQRQSYSQEVDPFCSPVSVWLVSFFCSS